MSTVLDGSSNMLEVTNVVSVVDLFSSPDDKLNLEVICIQKQTTYSKIYNPKRFPALRMMIPKPDATGMVYPTGKLICMGAKSEQDSYKAARRMARIISKLPASRRKIVFRNFKIKNVVGKADMGSQIDVYSLSEYLKTPLSAENEIRFRPPVVKYDMKEPCKVQFKVFQSGKVTMFGAKSEQDLHAAWAEFSAMMADYLKTQKLEDWMQSE